MKFSIVHHYGHPLRHPPPGCHGDEGRMLYTQQQLIGTSQVKLFIQGRYRYIVGNGLPNHDIDLSSNRKGSNLVRPQQYCFRVPLHPSFAEQVLKIHRQPFGVAINGVPFDPESAEFWNGDRHSGWQYEAMSSPGLDRSNAHTRSNGAYHYHGLPMGLMTRLGGLFQVLLIGYAADGFPIYAQYDSWPSGSLENPIKKVCSSYQLQKGQRLSGPRGEYDGTFVQDYEYVEATGDLDECNGHFGITPDYPEGIYHYHITEGFPFISRYFRGTPDASFQRQSPHSRTYP